MLLASLMLLTLMHAVAAYMLLWGCMHFNRTHCCMIEHLPHIALLFVMTCRR
jgi:hypothetical protein